MIVEAQGNEEHPPYVPLRHAGNAYQCCDDQRLALGQGDRLGVVRPRVR